MPMTAEKFQFLSRYLFLPSCSSPPYHAFQMVKLYIGILQNFVNAFVNPQAFDVNTFRESSGYKRGIVPIIFPCSCIEKNCSASGLISDKKCHCWTIVNLMTRYYWIKEILRPDVELESCVKRLKGDKGGRNG